MPIKTLVILAHFIFLLVYAVLVWALLWHYRKYSLPRDRARWIWGAFLFFSFVFAVVSSILLFIVPWRELIDLNALNQ